MSDEQQATGRILPRDELEYRGCTCHQGWRDGVLVDWVRAIQYHPYTDCPLRGLS